MIALSLVVYLGISVLLILPFMLRYLVVLRNERQHSGKSGLASISNRVPTNGHPLF